MASCPLLGLLAQGLAAAFQSDRRPGIGQMVGQLFGNFSGAQQAGMRKRLIASLPQLRNGLARYLGHATGPSIQTQDCIGH